MRNEDRIHAVHLVTTVNERCRHTQARSTVTRVALRHADMHESESSSTLTLPITLLPLLPILLIWVPYDYDLKVL